MSRGLDYRKTNLQKKIATQGYVFTDQAAPQKLNLRVKPLGTALLLSRNG